MGIKDIAARGHAKPGGLRGVLGVLAITWGTMTVGKIAADAREEADAAKEHLDLVQPRLAEARAELKDLQAQIGGAKDALRAEVVDAIREGHFDPHVRIRYTHIIAAQNQGKPYTFGPTGPGQDGSAPLTDDAVAEADELHQKLPR